MKKPTRRSFRDDELSPRTVWTRIRAATVAAH
jgi:hypothetical protein